MPHLASSTRYYSTVVHCSKWTRYSEYRGTCTVALSEPCTLKPEILLLEHGMACRIADIIVNMHVFDDHFSIIALQLPSITGLNNGIRHVSSGVNNPIV